MFKKWLIELIEKILDKRDQRIARSLRISFDNVSKDVNFIKGQIEILTNTTQENTQSTTQEKPQSLKVAQKYLLKKLNTKQLITTIQGLIDQGFKTTQIRDEIKEKFAIEDTCFYKYLKLVRTTQENTQSTTIKKSQSSKV